MFSPPCKLGRAWEAGRPGSGLFLGSWAVLRVGGSHTFREVRVQAVRGQRAVVLAIGGSGEEVARLDNLVLLPLLPAATDKQEDTEESEGGRRVTFKDFD